ncbi:hypothetical protein [Streptomyces sp. 4R-3d]|uniref:hypothetical protein n=1 Tax=Streptomyces sp. 4R-3d TaxID=2559605 RepID=UPI001FFDFA0F|nr:hypothetical protein [Streptomyces sp. 4R-3d]
MANLADEYGSDVEIYVKALTTTIHADTRTGAPTKLLDLLDQLGLERQEIRTTGPVYTWHIVPEHLGADEQKRLATCAVPALLLAGYKVNCAPDVFVETVYQQAVREIRAGNPGLPAPPAPHRPPHHPHHPGAPRKTGRAPVSRPIGETRNTPYATTDQPPPRTPPRPRPLPPLPAHLPPHRLSPAGRAVSAGRSGSGTG